MDKSWEFKYVQLQAARAKEALERERQAREDARLQVVEEQIRELEQSRYVRLARQEEQELAKRQEYLQQLRQQERRGMQLAKRGWRPREDAEE